jgi:hypothetical protein
VVDALKERKDKSMSEEQITNIAETATEARSLRAMAGKRRRQRRRIPGDHTLNVQKAKPPPATEGRMTLEADGCIYLYFAGKRIAKRGSGELEWTILIPGWTVKGGAPGDYDSIEISYEGESTPWGPH